MAALSVANAVCRSGRVLSELVRPLRRYHATGEINMEVHNAPAILDALRARYGAGRVLTLDGLSVELDDWWFNVRPSNTEPLLRLNLEARTRELMEAKRDEVLDIIRRHGA
jgi:phosphomannomutase